MSIIGEPIYYFKTSIFSTVIIPILLFFSMMIIFLLLIVGTYVVQFNVYNWIPTLGILATVLIFITGLVAYFLYRQHYREVDVGTKGLVIRYLTRTVELKWEDISSISVNPFMGYMNYEIRSKNGVSGFGTRLNMGEFEDAIKVYGEFEVQEKGVLNFFGIGAKRFKSKDKPYETTGFIDSSSLRYIDNSKRSLSELWVIPIILFTVFMIIIIAAIVVQQLAKYNLL